LIVNPVAGMGGSVGLKGTDGEIHEPALELGAGPVTPQRTRDTLAHLKRLDEMAFLAAPGQMGAGTPPVPAFLEDVDAPATVIGEIDEEAFRDDVLASRLYGTLMVPDVRASLQLAKAASNVSVPSEELKKDIARFMVEEMDPEILYLLGPGTTLRAITDELGVSKTLLGVDAVYDGELVGEDINEQDILDLFEDYSKRKIVETRLAATGSSLAEAANSSRQK
jgi:predicted polyphosphate/ATP-dependent NAD kinase